MNGCILWFWLYKDQTLCSIFILRSFIIPTLQWILPDGCLQITSQESCSIGGILRLYSFLRFWLVQLFYVSTAFSITIVYHALLSFGRVNWNVQQKFVNIFIEKSIILLDSHCCLKINQVVQSHWIDSTVFWHPDFKRMQIFN